MPALEVADIFRHHGEAYRHAHAGHLGRTERRIMGAIEACRTSALGGHVEHCIECGLVRSRIIRAATAIARNARARRAGLVSERQAELLSVPYFHVVFTLPAPVAEIAFQNKAVVYAVLFKAAARTTRPRAPRPGISGHGGCGRNYRRCGRGRTRCSARHGRRESRSDTPRSHP